MKTALLVLSLGFVILGIGYFMLKKENANLHDKLSLCDYQNQNLKAAIKQQNDALQTLSLQTKDYENNKANAHKQIITKIQALPAPVSKDGITCENAIAYIIKLQELQ